MIRPLAIGFCVAAFTLSARAGLREDVAACHAVANERARLACYDALSAPQADPEPAPVVATPPAAPLPPAAPSPPSATFGEASLPKPEAEEPSRIETHIVGKVHGWRRGTKFTLDNGQIWQSIDDRDSDDVLDAPAVTIKKNFVGHYWMSLAGTSQNVLVTRIK